MHQPRIDQYPHLSAVDVLDCSLPEQEVYETVSFEGTDELRFVQRHAVVLGRPYRAVLSDAPGYQIIGSGKVGRATEVVFATLRHQTRYVGLGVVRTLGDAVHGCCHSCYAVDLDTESRTFLLIFFR